MVGVQCLKFYSLLTQGSTYVDINNGLKEFSDMDIIVARCIGGGVSLCPEHQGAPHSFNYLLTLKLSSLDEEFCSDDARISGLLETWRVDYVDGWRYETV